MEVTGKTLRSVLVAAPPGIHCDALVSLLRAQQGIRIAAVVHTVQSVQSVVATGPIDVLIFDAALLGEGVVELLKILHRTHPSLRVVVLTAGAAQAAKYLQAGVYAAPIKGCLDEQLLHAVTS